jgi:inorganic triphosphatase YgiF
LPIRLFKHVVAGSDRDRIKTELEWITTELRPARDIDVLNAEVLPAISEVLHRQRDLEEAAHREFHERREQAYETARRAVRSPRFANAILEATEWIEAGQWTSSDDPLLTLRRERLIEPHGAAELARRRKKIRKKGRHLRELGAKQRHKIRIRAKKLRYAIEEILQGEIILEILMPLHCGPALLVSGYRKEAASFSALRGEVLCRCNRRQAKGCRPLSDVSAVPARPRSGRRAASKNASTT